MKTKHLLIALLATLALGSCTMYKPAMSAVKDNPLPAKFAPMLIDFNWEQSGIDSKLVLVDKGFYEGIIKPDLEKNFITQKGKKVGTLKVKFEKCQVKQSVFLGSYLSGLTMGVYPLLGGPISSCSTTQTITFIICDENNDEIQRYSYTESGKSVMGFYYGKSGQVVQLETCRKIMDRFRADVQKDMLAINDKLNSVASVPVYYAGATTQPVYQPVPQAKAAAPAIISDVDQNIPVSKKKSENTFALIIANENYTFLDNVSFANKDGETFKEYCVKTLGIPERQVWLYKDASLGIISGGIDKMLQAMSIFEQAKIIVYYCGHGIPDEKTGDAYIVPVDGKGTNTATCYSLNQLYETLTSPNVESVTYFFDACFTGANKEGSMLVAARGTPKAPKKARVEGNSVVFSASSGDETAMTFAEKGHGLFTYFLLKKLQETGGAVSYAELAEYIKKNVRKEAFLTNEKPQTPVVATSEDAKDIWGNMTLK